MEPKEKRSNFKRWMIVLATVAGIATCIIVSKDVRDWIMTAPMAKPLFWNTLFGALLGASFFLLLRNYKMLIARTYDPRYDKANIMRLIIGVVAGAVLPQLLVVLKQIDAEDRVMMGMWAILGGFSAEAVELVMTRIVEVMLAAVRGDNSAKVEADMREYKARLTEEQSKRNSAAREALSALRAATQDEAQQKKIDEAIEALK